jgi:hypothetical protein
MNGEDTPAKHGVRDPRPVETSPVLLVNPRRPPTKDLIALERRWLIARAQAEAGTFVSRYGGSSDGSPEKFPDESPSDAYRKFEARGATSSAAPPSGADAVAASSPGAATATRVSGDALPTQAAPDATASRGSAQSTAAAKAVAASAPGTPGTVPPTPPDDATHTTSGSVPPPAGPSHASSPPPASGNLAKADLPPDLTVLVYRYTRGNDLTNDEMGYGDRTKELFWEPKDDGFLESVSRINQRTKSGRQFLNFDHGDAAKTSTASKRRDSK